MRLEGVSSALAWLRSLPPRHGCGSAPVPLRASVSSALLAQETRLAAPPRSPSRSLPPAPAVRGMENSHSRWSLNRRGRRVPAPTARAISAGLPRPAACKRFECPSGARNAARRTASLAIPEPPARTSRQRFGGPQPSKVHSYRPASPGGRGVCALGRKHSLRRFPPGSPPKEDEREAAQPGGKGRRRRTFSTRALRVYKQTVNTASAA